ncbi:acyltransferase [Sporosarcina luteola]|uniref:acyltransferase n=1 Tax=Sporosarcina luteola TaxID=582850 RepID=UPI0020412670|nr:acyltransferase [Sporosarcina luteola]MCM3709208.1 acyltransferase [Sporosarcina luteola]
MKTNKVIQVIEREIIKKISYFNGVLFRNAYVKYLKKVGMKINGIPNFISSDVYFDGSDYSLITLNNNVTISREVMFLTHDGSMHTIKESLDHKNTEIIKDIEKVLVIKKGITIGENTFIGARVSLLPGTTVGKNVLIGACSVVKGKIPDNSIVVGNPAKVVGKTSEWLDSKIVGKEYL